MCGFFAVADVNTFPVSSLSFAAMSDQHTMTVKSIVINFVCLFIVAPVASVLILWGCWVLIPDPPPPPQTSAAIQTQTFIRSAPHIPVSGRTVYMASCARCHGDSGDGDGTEKLDRPARSFLAGGFSFGNTPEAVRRVVQHGVVGTPMPAFAGILNAQQTTAVVKYVLSMAPRATGASDAAELVVADRPLVARGMLSARGLWEENEPRGVLLGGTDGLTLSYGVQDVSFRAARQGGFVKRTDWEGRGGTPLLPTGQLIHWALPQPMFSEHGVAVPARFLGTSTSGGIASLSIQLPGATIREHGDTITHGAQTGYRRTLEIEGDASNIDMTLPSQGALAYLGQSDPWLWWRDGADLVGAKGMTSHGEQTVRLPMSGTLEIIVLPAADMRSAAEAGIPVGRTP
jgi:mono/diheme cytochrome c family protein